MMSSEFDTRVYQRENHTPWAMVSLARFMKDMALNGKAPGKEPVVFSMVYRPDVASRFWFHIEWTGKDGERHEAEAQSFEKMLWRAAEREMQSQQEQKEGKD